MNQARRSLHLTGIGFRVSEMAVGPNGEKRPTGVIANAVLVAKLATGEAQEECVPGSKGDKKKRPKKKLVELPPGL